MDLVRLAESGQLAVLVERSFPLADVAEAHRVLGEGRATGKLVLVP